MPITESVPIGDIAREAHEFTHDMFDLTKHDLANKGFDNAVDGIYYCIVYGHDPDGIPFPALSQYYETWKQAVVGDEPIGILFGLMTSRAELCGVRIIRPDHAIQIYGATLAGQIEATKFQEGGAVTGTNQPARPFYGFPDQHVYNTMQPFDRHFLSFMK